MEKTALFILICYLSQVTKGVEFCREKNEDKLEEGRECKKSCTREEDCKAPNKSCFCDSECGSSCFNKESTCGEPGEIENGRTITTHKLWGGVTHYTCRDGFVLKGRETRKCNADKRWGGNPPTCETGCSRPDDVANSYLTEVGDTFLVGEDYKFSCNSGYYMVGEPSRICISVEEGWSDAQYHCRPKLCDVLEDVQNGEIHYSKGYEFGSTATVQCHEGYRISSTRQSKKCYPGDDDSVYGDWRGVLPTCEIVTCPVPAAPDHGSIRDIDHVVLEYRQEIIYQCDEGYRISGPERGTCSAEGNWGNVPNCAVDPDCDFSDNSSPTCGYTSTRWNRVPTTNHFGLSGYAVRSGSGYSYLRSMSLPHHSVCLSFYYRFSTSSILKVEEVNSDDIYWATHENEISSTWISAAVTINPSSKFRFEFHADRYGVLLDEVTVVPKECENNCGPNPCQNGGTCYNRIGDFTCFCTREFTGRYCRIDRRCPDPPRSIPHGERTYISRAPLLPSSNAQYTCDTNHKFDGEGGIITRKTITCAASGSSGRSNWDSNPSELRCRAIECPPLSPGDNSRLLNPQAEWVVNDRAEFECENGWIGWDTQTRREMPMEIRCQSNGVWSGVPPNCIRPYCTYKSSANKANSPLPVNLQAKYPVGSKVYFKCKVGFELTGSGFSECIRMETWRGAIPTCSAITCPPPSQIDHVSGRQLYNRENYGFIWSVYCRQHYFLDGPRNMTCQWDGTWSEAPKCSAVYTRCQREMPTPANGTKEVTDDVRRTNFFCDDMFELRGEKRVFCGPGRRWYGDTPTCEEVAASGYANIGNLQYLAFTTDDQKGNYNEAQESCRKINGNLAVIYSEQHHRDIARELLTPLEEYPLIYIGLRKVRHTQNAFDWDTENILTDLPKNWQERSNDRHWDFSNYYNSHPDCVTLRRRDERWNRYHAYRKTDCGERHGFLCQRNVETCRPNPCQNGGTCVEDSCTCLEGFTGDRCQTKTQCDISILAGRGYRPVTRSVYSVGEKVPLICDTGYESQDGSGVAEAKCLKSRRWQYYKICREITCQNPNLPQNAEIVDRKWPYTAGATIYIRCRDSYELVGDTVMQCKLDGTWTTLGNGYCQRVKCGQPHLPQGAFVVRTKHIYEVDDRIEISCREGYRRIGERNLYCQVDKTWRPSEDRVECRKTEVATTTMRSSTTNPTTTTTRTRPKTTTPAPTPTSGAESCRDPKLPDLSYILDDVNDFPSGTTITLRCLGGRSVRGDPEMTCNNGEWTESNVKCVAITCSLDPYLLLYEGFDIEGMDYDDIQGTDFPVGQELTLVCFESETPTHDEDPKLPPRIVCQEGGRWSPGYRDFTCTNA